MKRNKFKLALLISLIILFSGFTAIYRYININLLKDNVVENFDSFSEELKISAWGWTTTEVVSTESTDHSHYPTIAVDGSGNVHITWHDLTNYGGSGGGYDIFYKCWNATTADWTTTEVVSTESGNSYDPTIAVDGSGNVHIVWHDLTNYSGSGTDRDIFYKHWNATTANWTTTEVVSTESTGDSWRQTIAVDGSGNLHIAWWDNTDYRGSGTDVDIFYKYWNATDATWNATEVVSTESTDGAFDPTIAVDGSGNVHIAWFDLTDYGGSGTDVDIFYKYWNATDATWNATEVVSTQSTSDSRYPTIAVDGFGHVHIAWHDWTNYGGSGTDADIFYRYWNATTATWNATEVVSTGSTGDSWLPTITVDGSENLHLAWGEVAWAGVRNIFYRRWNATMTTWTTTEWISTESGGLNSNFPEIAVEDSGNVHITWEDETYYDGSGNDWDIFYKKFMSYPINPSIIINNGDGSTNSTLVNLTLSADGATEMCFRNGTGGAWTGWEAYNTIKQLLLEGSVNNTVYTIQVKFQNAAGETSPVGDSILYEIFTPPVNPSIIINNGDVSTNSTLVNLMLSADGATEMCFRNGTGGTWTSWEAYSPTKQLYLEGSTNYTVYSIYVKFQNAVGETSQVNDSILYAIFLPLNPSIVINHGDASTDSNIVGLSLSAGGATEMCFRNGTGGTWTSWEAYSTTRWFYLEGSTNNTVYSIYVKFRNATGETSPVGDSILYVIFTPLNPSIVINNGDASTDSTLVTLTLSADGAIEMCFRNGTGGIWTSWEAYSTTKQVYLEGSTNNTIYSIYVKFQNTIGETSPVGDSILYGLFAPLNPSIIINNGDASTDSTLVTLTLSADLAVEMCFRNGTGVTWTSWEAYSTTKQLYLESSTNNTVHSIYVKFRNTIGETSPVGDSILYVIFTHPLNPSIVINNGDESTYSTLVTLTLSADGATEMCFRNGMDGVWTSWEVYSTTKQWYLEGSVIHMEYTIYVKFRNTIGETSPVGDSIRYLITDDGEEEEEEEASPFIPGYPDGWIIISLVAGIGLIAILDKSKRIKLRN